MRFLIILFLFLITGNLAICQDKLVSGLFFSSHEVIQDKRTSLNLTPSDPFKFPYGFSLEMDANFRKGDGYYGYIFRIIGDSNTNIDLVSNMATRSSNFSLILKDKVLFTFNLVDIPEGGTDRWIKIKFDINIREKKLAISFNGNKQEALVPAISGLRNFEMVFGACRNKAFINTDVSPMSLKDIRIFDAKKKLVNEWKLSKHAQNKVYDEIKHDEATIENPNWNIDSHVKWRKLKELRIDSLIGIARDEERGRVFFVDRHAVYMLSTESAALDTIQFSGGFPYNILGSQIIYNKFTNELWSYKFDQNAISKFNFLTKTWSENLKTTKEPDFWHHNKFVSPIDSSLVTLMGYGFYTYKSIIHQYNPKLKLWQNFDRSDQIEPRYLSGCGFLNNKEVLVFGGYGSKTGRQELSPEFYYDLYSFNLTNYTFKKLWTLNSPSKPFVPCEALIPDQQLGIFYTLIYNKNRFASSLHLAKFGIEKNEYQLFNDSIPYNFLDIQSWSTLFLDQKTKQLIAITSHNSAVSLYSISYPPLMPEDVYQSIPVERRWYFWLIGVFLSGGLVLLYIVLVRKKNKQSKKDGYHDHIEHPNIIPIEANERKTISAIYLIGGFQIFNSRGQNITSAFSPTLKQLFLFILLHTIQKGRGISSVKLDEVLWFDKSGDSARNNRNVNISKLRTVLEELEGAEVLYENSFWTINLGNIVYCDYQEIFKLLRKSKSTTLTEGEIHELISILSFGELLPAVQTEWMDGFKSKFTNDIIDGLCLMFTEDIVKNNFSLRYHLAECILLYDPLNDEAFAMKCSVLYHLGKKGMAKNSYDSFCHEYKLLLGTDYAVSFNDTVK